MKKPWEIGWGKTILVPKIKQKARGNLNKIIPEELISSNIPEEVVMAILSGYRREQSLGVIKRILSRLKELSTDESAFKKYIKQLTILSRLRKLESETKKEAENMPIHYDIETDGLYIEGLKKGREEGREEGREKMLLDAVKNVMTKLPQTSDHEIADLLNAPLELVMRVRRELSSLQ